jgi:DNA-binding MarR family transcriptional regulator
MYMNDDLSRSAPADPARFELWKTLVRVERMLLAALEAKLEASEGIGLTEYEALDELQAAPEGRLRMNELAASVILTPSGLTRLVDRLEVDGTVTRESCPTDGRGSHVRITPKGVALLKRAEATYQLEVARHFGARFTDTDALALKKACDHILASTRADTRSDTRADPIRR